jgi:hypothetical protein
MNPNITPIEPRVDAAADLLPAAQTVAWAFGMFESGEIPNTDYLSAVAIPELRMAIARAKGQPYDSDYGRNSSETRQDAAAEAERLRELVRRAVPMAQYSLSRMFATDRQDAAKWLRDASDAIGGEA